MGCLHVAAVILCVALAGCASGSSGSSDGAASSSSGARSSSSGGGSSSSSSGNASYGHTPGTYTIQFEAPVGGPCAPGGNTQILSGSTARLDIHGTPGALRAFVSFPFKAPAAFAVNLDGRTLVLTGDVQGRTNSYTLHEEERWTRMELQLEADGTPTSGHAEGTYAKWDGSDVGCNNWNPVELSSSMSVSADAALPEKRFGPDIPLPWSTLRMEVSEPIAATQWANAALARIDLRGGSTSYASFIPVVEDPPIAELGYRGAELRGDWDDQRGALVTVQTTNLIDPAGNVSEPFSTAVRVLDPGEPVASQEFDGPGGFVATGGPHVSTGGLCDTTACMDFGEVRLACRDTAVAVALRVGAPTGQRIKVRYRARVVVGVPLRLPALSVLLNAAGEEQTYSYPNENPSGAWQVVEVPIPAAWQTADIGVTILPGMFKRGMSGRSPECVTFVDARTQMVVDRVWIE